MSVTPDDLARLASLAALDIPDDQRPALAAQLDRIVSYVGQLATLADAGQSDPAEPESGCRLRADAVSPQPLTGSLADFAPRFMDGFFLVPR